MPTLDFGNIKMNWKGDYSSTIDYIKDDVVSFEGSSYLCLKSTKNINPVEGENWGLLADGLNKYLTNVGDLLTFDGSSYIRIPIGSEAQILKVGEDGLPRWEDDADFTRRVWKLPENKGSKGENFRSVLMRDGMIRSTGWGDSYRNGDIAGIDLNLLQNALTDPEGIIFEKIFVGVASSFALTEDGRIFAQGKNTSGELGMGNTLVEGRFKEISYFALNNIRIKKVFPSQYPYYMDSSCTFFLTTTGDLYATGINTSGQLGLGHSNIQVTPAKVPVLSNVKEFVISGRPHTALAINGDDKLFFWGDNSSGQFGIGSNVHANTPTQHSAFDSVKKIAVATAWSSNTSTVFSSTENFFGTVFVIDGAGDIWTAGNNFSGQLGLGDNLNRISFSKIQHTEKFRDIFCSDGYQCSVGAISETNKLYVWGNNIHGQLGTGDEIQRLSPFLPSPNSPWQGHVKSATFGGNATRTTVGDAITTTPNIACFVHAGDEILGAGYGEFGNIGNGTTNTINSTFSEVLGRTAIIKDWSILGTGAEYGILVLYEDGRVMSCGFGGKGETGTKAFEALGNEVNLRVMFL